MSEPVLIDDQRFRQLIDASCDQRLTTKEMAELDAALRGNPERLRSYRDICRLHSDLHLIVNSRLALNAICSQLEACPPAYEQSAPQPQCGIAFSLEASSPTRLFDATDTANDLPSISFIGQPAGTFVRWWPQVSLLAGVLVIALGVLWWPSTGRAPDPAGLAADGAFHGATDTKSLGVSSVQLDSGAVNIQLPGIGYVIIEGPASLDMLGPMRARLNTGRIKMRVTQQSGRGFVVETPYGDVTDLGTEFGLNVSDKGLADLVVFEGQVDLRPMPPQDAPRGFSRIERLVGGEAVQFGNRGQLDRIMSIVTGSAATFDEGRSMPGDDSLPIILQVSDNLPASQTKNYYEIVRTGLQEDARAFVDRPTCEWNGVTDSGMPAYLIGADYVKTFCNYKRRDDLEITVRLGRPAKLYVFFDRRLPVPDWLEENFQSTGDLIGLDHSRGSRKGKRNTLAQGAGMSIDNTFLVWERFVTEPGIITLGPNSDNVAASSMYGIAAIPLLQTGASK